MAQRFRSQQQHQPQPPQHKTLTKVNSGPGSPCGTYLGSDKQLYCDKNLQQIQNLSALRQSYNPYMCHSCLTGRPVSLVTPEAQVVTSVTSVASVARPGVRRALSPQQPRVRSKAGQPVTGVNYDDYQ